MQIRTILMCAGTALAMSAPADGDYRRLLLEPYVGTGWVENGFAGLTAYRLYAWFNEPTDGVVAVFGSPDYSLHVTSSSGTFFNSAIADSLTAPEDLTPTIWSNQWDTYVTIGTDDALGDATGLSPGFAQEVGNLAGSFTTNNAAWFVTPIDPQAEAGPGCVVLLGQFVVPEGEHVNVMVSIMLIGGATLYHEGILLLPPCPADLTGDDIIDVEDLLALLPAWGPCSCCPADINHDATVDVTDLLMLLEAWGPCWGPDGPR